MLDESMRRKIRSGNIAYHELARAGHIEASTQFVNGNGKGYGDGDGNGNVYADGDGYGCGYGYGDGSGGVQ